MNNVIRLVIDLQIINIYFLQKFPYFPNSPMSFVRDPERELQGLAHNSRSAIIVIINT